MKIGAANASEQHAHFDVVDAWLRLGNILEPEAAAILGFDQSFHRNSLRWVGALSEETETNTKFISIFQIG